MKEVKRTWRNKIGVLMVMASLGAPAFGQSGAVDGAGILKPLDYGIKVAKTRDEATRAKDRQDNARILRNEAQTMSRFFQKAHCQLISQYSQKRDQILGEVNRITKDSTGSDKHDMLPNILAYAALSVQDNTEVFSNMNSSDQDEKPDFSKFSNADYLVWSACFADDEKSRQLVSYASLMSPQESSLLKAGQLRNPQEPTTEQSTSWELDNKSVLEALGLEGFDYLSNPQQVFEDFKQTNDQDVDQRSFACEKNDDQYYKSGYELLTGALTSDEKFKEALYIFAQITCPSLGAESSSPFGTFISSMGSTGQDSSIYDDSNMQSDHQSFCQKSLKLDQTRIYVTSQQVSNEELVDKTDHKMDEARQALVGLNYYKDKYIGGYKISERLDAYYKRSTGLSDPMSFHDDADAFDDIVCGKAEKKAKREADQKILIETIKNFDFNAQEEDHPSAEMTSAEARSFIQQALTGMKTSVSISINALGPNDGSSGDEKSIVDFVVDAFDDCKNRDLDHCEQIIIMAIEEINKAKAYIMTLTNCDAGCQSAVIAGAITGGLAGLGTGIGAGAFAGGPPGAALLGTIGGVAGTIAGAMGAYASEMNQEKNRETTIKAAEIGKSCGTVKKP